jgi:hypothetical protein
MGENANQTSDEIAALRGQMGDRVTDLQRMVVPKIRRARNVAITTAAVGVGVVVVGGVMVTVLAARRRQRRKRELTELRAARSNPSKHAGGNGISPETRDAIKAELRDELARELRDGERDSLSRRVLAAAVKTGASAAIPAIIRQLEKHG